MEISFKGIEHFAVIAAGILLLILGYQLICMVVGRNILVPTAQWKLQNKVKQQIEREKFLRFYTDIIYKIVAFKRKYRLFGMDAFVKSDKEIILERTNQRITSESIKTMTMEEWDAVHTLWSGLVLVVGIVLLIFMPFKIKLGVLVGIVVALVLINFGHFASLRTAVSAQNKQMTKQFGDFYLKQHNILMTEKSKAFTKGLLIYKDVAKDPFMRQWTETTLNLIKQDNEQTVLDHYLVLYRDIPILTKLLRLERDIVVGSSADTTIELQGMRQQVLEQRKRDIKDGALAKEAKANRIIRLVYAVVAQSAVGFIAMTIFQGGLNFG